MRELQWRVLHGSDFSRANLEAADFTKAWFGWNTVGAVNLATVKGLETAVPVAPSTIGIDTICQSEDRIPEIFLRGAGLPDSFITYARSLVGRAIEFYSCFISYASPDQAFAERLHAGSKNLRCWFARKI